MQNRKGVLVLGTDTDVGKTYVSCRIIESLVKSGIAVGAYKPVASGALSPELSDASLLWHASGQRGTLSMVNPQSFKAALAPPMAAELEGATVDDQLLLHGFHAWKEHCEWIVAEGAGGLMSPISWDTTNADFASSIGLPIVLVAENRIGVVNQVLTTLVATKAMGLDVRCVVLNETPNAKLNDCSRSTNLRLLNAFLDKQSSRPMLTCMPSNGATFTPAVQWDRIDGMDYDGSYVTKTTG
jgi:dethiobiotin synthetase